jgi:ferrous iron transport protein A
LSRFPETPAAPRNNFVLNKGRHYSIDEQGAPNMDTCMTLRRAQVNQKLRICSIGAQGELGRRIRDMGIIPGAEVTVVGKAPLKDPVALRLRDFTLTLRNSEADHILVEAAE